MSNEFIPRGDAAFNIWQADALSYVEQNAEAWHIPAPEVETLKAQAALWNPAFAKASNRETRSHADVLAKDEARKSYEKAWRRFAQAYLTNNPALNDEQRMHMGIHPRDNAHTPHPVPHTSPVATVDFSVRFQHKINFTDEQTPTSKAKPAGVHGCEIWMKLDGEAPQSQADLRYLATDTATPHIVEFGGEDGGKTAYYWLRWVNTRGETGPWSAPVSALVAK